MDELVCRLIFPSTFPVGLYAVEGSSSHDEVAYLRQYIMVLCSHTEQRVERFTNFKSTREVILASGSLRITIGEQFTINGNR